ncbi:MAG: radical SAM protein [Firmicutes bacterium]|jgi:MoaA/NifB/PqqE/SkfB family radical SAM enzyme|nr:radical SAM protein [Bacillota bacterium]
MDQQSQYLEMFSRSVVDLFKDALRISLKHPTQVGFFLRTIKWQKQAVKRRAEWEQKGLHMPPFMIVSVTNKCNLQCKGCYNRAQHRQAGEEMSEEKLRSVLSEAWELGISIALLAGGEPLVRPDLMRVTRDFPQIVFPVFTNGLLIDDEMIEVLSRQRHVVPVISLEGHETDTDDRRGVGVHNRLTQLAAKLKAERIFFGMSLTLRSSNVDTVLDEAFIQGLIDAGCKLFFFVEYVPVEEGTDHWCLTEDQRVQTARAMKAFRASLPGLFIAFPGDEEEAGGCLAAGRGFIHISPQGSVEPCPFAPYSDTSLQAMSLKEALGSPLLQAIRENHEHLRETRGGCALWENREWVKSLLQR